MDIHLYIRSGDDEYEIGRMLCQIVPRIGETVYLRMSLRGYSWQLDPNNPVRLDIAYFLVSDVAYEGYNVMEVEEGMGAAPLHEGSTLHTVQLYVTAKNDETQVYIDRIINREKLEVGE